MYSDILEAMGHTPLVRLNHMTGENDARVLVKCENLNVGGSIKTRTACHMIREAIKRGDIGPDTVVVEPTSGNQGIGLALTGAVMGLKVRIIMPDSVSLERRKLISAYGAELVLVHDEGNIGKCIDECLNMAMEMKKNDPRVYVPQQFENPDNPAVHTLTTAREILAEAEGAIDGFCAGVGTGGTLSGVGHTLREKWPEMEIWAVEPENAAMLSGGSIGSHLQMGIGDGLVPKNLDTSIYTHVAVISDQEAMDTTRALIRKEGILCGISSGSNVAAAIRMAKKLGRGKTVVTILPDTGERYFSTPLFDGE